MRGIVKFIKAAGDLVAVLTEHGEYTIIEILENDQISVGDIIRGPLETLDHQILENETRNTHLNVYIQDLELVEADARARVT